MSKRVRLNWPARVKAGTSHVSSEGWRCNRCLKVIRKGEHIMGCR